VNRKLASFVFATTWLAVSASAHECPLFGPEMTVPIVHLDANAIDVGGTVISDANMRLVDAIESAYRDGHYGKPGRDEAKKTAFAAFIYNTQTAFDFFLTLALQDSVVYSTSEDDLREAFTHRFRNPGLYPVVNLVDARTGLGRFCLKFDVHTEKEREIKVSGEKLRAWTETLDLRGTPTRIVNIDMKTMSHDRVHVVYEEHSDGEVRTFDIEDKGHPVRVVSMEGIDGQYVRKWGFHKPTALTLWKSHGDGVDPPPSEGRYLGSAIYVPHLQLQLPWFLPDIGFDDLKRFDFPEPLLTMDAVHQIRDRKLEWLRIKDDYRFAEWDGEGDIPQFVKDRFPDE
jgi:hypothetical protein